MRPRETDRAGLGDALEPRCDIDAVSHQIAVALLDDVAEMDADAKFMRRSAEPPALRSTCMLNFYCATHGVDNAARFDQRPVAGTLHDPAVVHGDGGIDQVAAQSPKAQRPVPMQ